MNSAIIRWKELPGFENLDINTLSPAEIEAEVRRNFAFLPKQVSIRVTGDTVTIEFPEAAANAAEALRLCDRAGK
jgi:hypothetical protein